MGVKDLWNIISPSCDRKPLYELQGKVIAIDLSGWVVDSQSIIDNVIQPKMYLRNLFFRTAFLLMNEVYPVFVLEGTAPSLKHKTIAKRNEVRNGPQQKKTSRKGGRSNFNKILKECENMLKYMGISCIRGQGEAEAMCALLNAEGLVDGCISQDSDCFLYGAKVVYRNFCTSAQGNRGTTGGSIDEYTIEKIERVYQLGRNKMIALALLCGCDYDEGLNGVGKEAALKLFKIVSESNIIERMKSWKTDSTFTKMEAELANPNICTTCGHNGKMRSHVKTGCRDCGTSTKCNDTYKEKRILLSNELSIRKKALLVDNFPSEELINEFLHHKDSVPSNLDLKWKTPQVSKFVTFMEMYVLWEPEYAYAKILPLLTRWQVRNLAEIPDDRRLTMRNLLVPEKIKKPRNIKGIATYEVVWEDKDGIFQGMTLACTSDKENDSEEPPASPTELATLEPQHLFQKCYPLLVEEFENARLAKKKKPAKPRAKKAKATDDATTEKPEEKKKAQRRPRKPKATEVAKNRKMDEFIKLNIQTLEDSFDALTITPKRKKKTNDVVESENKSPVESKTQNSPQFRDLDAERLNRILNGSLLRMFNELTPEDFPSEAEDENMSIIVEKDCRNSQAMNVSPPRNQSLDYVNDFQPEFDFHPEFHFEPQFDLEPESDLKPDVNLDPELDLEPKSDLHRKFLESESDLEPKYDIATESHLEFDLSMKYEHNSKPVDRIKKKEVKSMNESENLDCTLKRIIDSHKNAGEKKKPISMIKSPNVFAVKKARKKFDIVNFTFERENSPGPKMNYKISEECIKQSSCISNLLNSKFADQDDSMEKFDRLNASLERFLFGRELINNPETATSKSEQTDSEMNREKVLRFTRNDSEENLEENKDSVKKVMRDSVKRKNQFSLERTLHVKNLIRDFKNSDSCDDSVFRKADENDLEEDVDSLNSSLERLRFAQPSSVNLQNNQIENSGSDVFNLSKIKSEEKSANRTNVENSMFELVPIVQRAEESTNGDEIGIESFRRKNEAIQSFNRDFDVKKSEESFLCRQNDFQDIHEFSFDKNEEKFVLEEITDIQNFQQVENEENDRNSHQNESENFPKLENHKIKRIIPDEVELTDESDMFDFSSECSQHFESPGVQFTKEEQRIRKSTNILPEKLQLPDNNESMDEFDLLISSCKPLCERLDDLQKPEVVRTSTPDFVVTPGKKFSFGIDDLLNDTDL